MDTLRPVMMSIVVFFYIAVLCYFSFAPCMFLIDGICKSHFMIKADFQISLMEGQLSFVDCK